MGKRRQAVSELAPKNAEEWEKLREHPGLIVVDVYTEWAGPCDVMKPIIYKIKAKMQQSIGEDMIHYATACADLIPCLRIFKEC